MTEIIKKYPTVALIGRTNVGKSTIFNRLTDNAIAIVSHIPGTTRDLRHGECQWIGKTITITDTAGLDIVSDIIIDKKSVNMAEKSIAESDLVLLIVDVRDGLLPQDKAYIKLIQKSGKPFFLVINKVDSQRLTEQTDEFYKLGVEKFHMISAKTGAGTGDLLDDVFATLETKNISTETTEIKPANKNNINIALIGKPNVGKSSLLNAILGEEKSIVSEIPHTTRDSQDFTFYYEKEHSKKSKFISNHAKQIKTNSAEPETADNNKSTRYSLTFVDTAGIIKSRKINDKLQELSIAQSLDSLKKCDIALLLFDAGEPVTMQDKTLTQEIENNYKSIIFVVNKWDLVDDKTTHSDKEYTQYLASVIPFLTWAPVVFVSAKTGFKIQKLIDVIIEIYEKEQTEFEQTALDDFLASLLKKKTPPRVYGTKAPYLFSMRQTGRGPLTFEFLASQSIHIDYSYQRFIKKYLRQKFDLAGCSIKLNFVEKTIQHGEGQPIKFSKH